MRKTIMFILGFVLLASVAFAENINLTLASFGGYEYFHALLKESLEAQGHKVTITKLSPDYEQKRVLDMLGKDDTISLHWIVQTPERDSTYVPVEVGITDGLIGKRILFIGKGKQSEFDGVKSIDDFKKLGKIGAFGKGWFDVKVWQINDLKVVEKDGSWDPEIYNMLAAGNRGIDYFSRGAHEIVVESPKHPELDIEKNIVLIYDRDMRYYLSKSNAQYKPIIETALKKAKENGLMDKLIRKYFSEVFDKSKVNLDGRTKIKMNMPK